MGQARLQAIEAIFHDALDVEPGRLAAFLDERCAADASLRLEVEALLAAHRRADGFIDIPVATLDGRLFEADDADDRLVGTTIGHWEIQERIGSGGMGAVYRARRADRQYEQQAAIKLIKRGMDTDAVLRRFRNERQILAGFDHPNIARLLDGDTTADGLPYFVMEYVEGLPIDAYCDRHALPVAARLRLFREVCAAVSYAHRHAVIHRDLKCSNILVSSDGVPKLLDFGIARLLQPGAAADSATLFGMRALTPEYASPEQVRGDPVTTASDVYSLGVVLYRLLTGQSPYRVAGQSPELLARTVGETVPQKPSVRLDGAGARPLRGDLDNIVLMALRKEPERRYASVDQFSDDIRRHLEARPVLARRDTLAYRAGKFVRRNTAVSVAAALVVLSLVGGIVATSWQAHRARTQEAIALAEKARAEHRFDEVRRLARAVLFDYHDAIKDITGATAIRERLVKDGLAYLDSLAGEAADDPALQRELAAAYDRVGDVLGEQYVAASLGDSAGAMDSYLKALQIREALATASPEDLQNRRELAGSYRKVGIQLIETSATRQGMEFLRKGLSVYEKLAAERPSDTEIWQDLASAYNSLGLAVEDAGDAVAAQESHRKALALREKLLATDPDNPKLRRSVVISDINLGRALFLAGDFEGGLASNRKALAICEALVAGDPRNADYRRLLANTYQNDGDYRAIMGDVKGALQSFRRKLALDKQAVAEDPANAVARYDISYTHERLADLLARSGEFRDALAYYRKAFDEGVSLGAESSEELFTRFHAILVRGGIAEMEARLGETASALAHASRARELVDGIAPDPGSGTRSSLRGQVYMRIAAIYAALGSDARLGAAERRQHWQTARSFYAQGLAVWQDMQARGILTAEDGAKSREAAAEIARCDTSLSQLAG